MSIEQTEAGQVNSERASSLSAVLRRTRHLDAATIDGRMSAVMITATLLVIPVLVLEAQPLGAPWHTFAVVGDWLIWLVFLVEFAAIIVLAKDWRSWLRAYPLAPALIVLTPPFAPAGLQTLRLFRLLRLIRVARGAQLVSKLLTLDGLKFVVALAVFLIIGGGAIFAGVESHVGHHVSAWDGIWWALRHGHDRGKQRRSHNHRWAGHRDRADAHRDRCVLHHDGSHRAALPRQPPRQWRARAKPR